MLEIHFTQKEKAYQTMMDLYKKEKNDDNDSSIDQKQQSLSTNVTALREFLVCKGSNGRLRSKIQ
jgi:hypothetical protein